MPPKTPRPATQRKAPVKTPPAVVCRVEVGSLNAHLFNVTLTIAQPAAQQLVSLPVWIPGSYLVREFAGQLQGLKAQQARRALPASAITQQDKCSWLVACDPSRPLMLRYAVHANDPSVRTATLSAARGFFNSTSLCLRVAGQEDLPHALEVPPVRGAADWSLATGLQAQQIDAQGFGLYQAADYDELADCPVEMGAFWSGRFKAGGVPHRFVVAGAAPTFDGERLLADAQKICEAQIAFWHGQRKPPFANYLFMLNVVDDGYGGLEHRNSTALICGRRDLPRLGESKLPEGYTTLRGLISHEYFHTWNVKRLRPAEFARYDYSRENYTELLWFFEGFTSYYDDLLLRRCGLLDNAGYLKLLTKTVNQVLQTPGRQVQTVAQASFDAWVKYYRPGENTPNATVSYYTKGALVALCCDLRLRGAVTPNSTPTATLDQVMRGLWQRCQGGPMTEADFLAELQALSGRSFEADLAQWVHSLDELPLKELLEQHGVAVLQEPAQLAQRLGLRVNESQGLMVQAVLSGGAAQAAGFSAGDEWLGLEPAARNSSGSWRLNKLDDLLLYLRPGEKCLALVARDKRLLRLPLTLPPAATTWRLTAKDSVVLDRWLDASHQPPV